MKNNYRKLKAIFKMFDYDFAYVSTIHQSNLIIQANFNGDLLKKISSHKFKTELDSKAGWISCTRSNIEILLT